MFLHGLGLDANDFRPYLVESRYHCIALTMYGFNAFERTDEHYRPISLLTHTQLLNYAVDRIRSMHPRKRITLVGFSFGADMIFLLSRVADVALRRPGIHKVVLLDPNVNRQTTTISSKIAQVRQVEDPNAQLLELLRSANNASEFRYLCEYLYKIMSKNLEHIRRHAADMVAEWDVDGPDHFLDLLGQLTKATHGAHVVFSFNHERLFNSVAHAAADRGMNVESLQCSQLDHFELIGAGFLRDVLEGAL